MWAEQRADLRPAHGPWYAAREHEIADGRATPPGVGPRCVETPGMPLDEYRAKRDFTRTPEPAGGRVRPRRDGERFFCVQKHLATALHYDFRLEHDGVLLSWAVPKGPSIDPTVKRLAMQTEDHPYEYGGFEGVIPDGYGAGVVMLWDVGTWYPQVDDVDAALRKGDLKLRLDGYKLKGSWALVRTRGYGSRGAGRSDVGDGTSAWLLIKHKDEWAGPLDIAEFAPLSVKSGGDFADILTEGLPRFWQGNRKAAQDLSTVDSLKKIVEKVAKLGPSRKPAPAAEPAPVDTANAPPRARSARSRPGTGKKRP